MALELKHDPGAKLLNVTITGKLKTEDYENFVPVVEDLIQRQGKIDVLLILYDFKGWTAGALWEDIKFDMKHFRDIDKVAIVGDRKWEQGMAIFCKPFTAAKVKYFDKKQLADARQWAGSEQQSSVNAS